MRPSLPIVYFMPCRVSTHALRAAGRRVASVGSPRVSPGRFRTRPLDYEPVDFDHRARPASALGPRCAGGDAVSRKVTTVNTTGQVSLPATSVTTLQSGDYLGGTVVQAEPARARRTASPALAAVTYAQVFTLDGRLLARLENPRLTPDGHLEMRAADARSCGLVRLYGAHGGLIAVRRQPVR